MKAQWPTDDIEIFDFLQGLTSSANNKYHTGEQLQNGTKPFTKIVDTYFQGLIKNFEILNKQIWDLK
jgi:hypothetical protein